MQAQKVTIAHRIFGFEQQPAVQVGNLIYSDINYYRHEGPRRLFWLLEYGAQLIYEPFGWQAEWYVDMVSITPTGMGSWWVEDKEIDLVVERMGPTYRIVDLDKFGQKVETGIISIQEASKILTNTQRLLDAFLHRGAPWPPPPIVPFFAADHNYPDFALRS